VFIENIIVTELVQNFSAFDTHHIEKMFQTAAVGLDDFLWRTSISEILLSSL
jgi:hypothetical protein